MRQTVRRWTSPAQRHRETMNYTPTRMAACNRSKAVLLLRLGIREPGPPPCGPAV